MSGVEVARRSYIFILRLVYGLVVDLWFELALMGNFQGGGVGVLRERMGKGRSYLERCRCVFKPPFILWAWILVLQSEIESFQGEFSHGSREVGSWF